MTVNPALERGFCVNGVTMDVQIFTAREAAGRFRMCPKAVSMWHSKGWINEHGTRQFLEIQGYADNGAAQYAWQELLFAERDTRRKTNRSHRRTGFAACRAG